MAPASTIVETLAQDMPAPGPGAQSPEQPQSASSLLEAGLLEDWAAFAWIFASDTATSYQLAA